MTPDERNDLRRKAEAATPGPWQVYREDVPYTAPQGGDCVERTIHTAHDHPQLGAPIPIVTQSFGLIARPVVSIDEADARFIAAANPAAVLALLDALDAAEARTPTTTSPIAPGVVFRMDDGRDVRVSGMPDGVTVCRDRRGRVAVRNVATNRLSYVHEGALRSMPLRAGAQPCRCGTCPPEERTEDPDYGF